MSDISPGTNLESTYVDSRLVPGKISLTCSYVAGPAAVSCEMLKSWQWPGDNTEQAELFNGLSHIT